MTSTTQTASKGKSLDRKRLSAELSFWAFVTPAIAGLVLFMAIPMVWGFLLSLSRAQNTIHFGHFIGLRNYTDLLSDPDFLNSLWTIFVFTLFIVPTTFLFSLWLAIAVHNIPRGKAFFRTVFFIPTAVSYAAASLIARMSFFSGQSNGFANHIIGLFGLAPIQWIGTASPPWYWLVLVSVRLWLQVGFYMIIFLAALQQIPRSLYEAAALDGASGGFTVFRYITLPQLRAATVSVLLLNLIAAFQAFDEFYNILGGSGSSSGNIGLARPPLVYIYNVALSSQDFGRGAAGGFIITFIIVAFTLVQGRLFGFGSAKEGR